uniref:AlNc14C64G4569 protein n=1 Tax=Albugo laibachii Nc14 TaxID=890382 RepID=F0WD48_9STRA|nr:AlNc14C64G4569 [Albugo laibachii Nc14]|eukprot:CCA19120.1 AlNc14C64G4569 [Albugo laibachii Nc14]
MAHKRQVAPSFTFAGDQRRASVPKRLARNQYGDCRRSSKRSIVTQSSQVSSSHESLRDIAKAALTARRTTVGDVTFGRTQGDNVRDSIRRIQAYSLRDPPIDTSIRETMCTSNKRVEVTLNRHYII